jgi:ADP-dependent NAD(P)H-hydrate dehydratase
LSKQPPSPGSFGTAQDREVDTALLREWPLPNPDDAADKDERGSVLLVGGCSQMPGALILAALGAMRAGAGKICLATSDRVATAVAQAVPEARVIGVPESAEGGLQLHDVECLPHDVDAVVIGPGMRDEAASVALTRAVLDHCDRATFVIDALAMAAVQSRQMRRCAIVITPHPGEMAHLTGCSKEEISRDLRTAATNAAERWQVIVALKTATTVIAAPSRLVWHHRGGDAGLAISGSGDVLAGIIGGLCARGASAEQATVWGVALHARSGARLAEKVGPVGYLAREIPNEVPVAMRDITQQ